MVDEESWMEALLLVAMLGGILVFCGSVLSSRRQWRDWLMIFGSAFATLGLGIWLVFIFEVFNVRYQVEEFFIYVCFGTMGVGMLMFGMGFLVDQVRYRAILEYRKQMMAMQEVTKSIAEQGGRIDG